MEDKLKKTTQEVEVQEQPCNWNKIIELTKCQGEIISNHLAIDDTFREDRE